MPNQLIEISEPQKLESNRGEVAVGIDFGTTNSLVAFSKGGDPYIIDMVKSIVGMGSAGKLEVMDSGFLSVKRFLGRDLDDNFSKKIVIEGLEFSPIEISSVILDYLRSKAEEHLGQKVTKAVITVPAYFDDRARNDVLLAAKMAGIDVLRLINEPTAAAFAYGLASKAEGVYLVYDFGGGTFDVSILNMRMGVFQVLSVGGDNMLGGDDIDEILLKKFGNKIESVKRLKERLSYEENIDGISRAEFEDTIKHLIDRTIDITREVLLNSEREIKGIILVGGSTRIPKIKEELSKAFNVEIFDDLDPDKVVALGASLQAENLTNPLGNLLIDVLPLSLGIEIMGGMNEKIILRNSPIPTTVTKEFTTHVDNQTAMKFHILQGEREMAKDCRSLGIFELKNIPPMKAGMSKIKLSFSVDADGIVSVSAIEDSTRVTEEFQLNPSYGITDTKAIEMLKDAYENAEQDHITRLLKESLFKAEVSLQNIYKALEETPELLSNQDRKKIDNAIGELVSTIDIASLEDLTDALVIRDKIIEKLEKMNQISEQFFLDRLNKGLSHAIKGKKIDEVDGVN